VLGCAVNDYESLFESNSNAMIGIFVFGAFERFRSGRLGAYICRYVYA
jgi:hypothetical protein